MAIVALTWLPYISARCIEGATGGCPLVAAEYETEGRSHHEGGRNHAHQHEDHAAEDHGTTAHHHNGGEPSVPERTCCERTGKCAVEVTSWMPTAPPAVAVAMVATIDVLPKAMRAQRARRVADPTHHPPPYIRFATLLI
jgi:ABC-type Zn2+ transport system substrate-binding protein/surface adhesin